MATPRPVLPALGAENAAAPPSAAIAEQGFEALPVVDTVNHQDQLAATLSRARHKDGTRKQTNSSSSQSSSVNQYLQTGSLLTVDTRLEATGEALNQIDFIINFIKWISESEFLRFQRPEPLVGVPSSNCPPTVEQQGIKGHSIYTALFHHLDMETFPCKLCPHVVKDDFELAILHQRVVHFHHYPYQCLTTQTQCEERFANQAGLDQHQHSTGH